MIKPSHLDFGDSKTYIKNSKIDFKTNALAGTRTWDFWITAFSFVLSKFASPWLSDIALGQ